MKTLCTTLLLALSTMPLTACDDPEPAFGADRPGDAVAERCVSCGIKFNTNKFGSHYFSEIDLLGDKHDGVILDYVKLGRATVLDSVRVEAGQIVGVRGSVHYDGDDFVNSEWHMQVELEGVWTEVLMRLTTAQQDPYYGWLYTFTHEIVGGPKEQLPNCDEDPNAPGDQFKAIVTEDISVDTDKGYVSKRANTMFIGCLSGGVGKAGYWGYPKFKVGIDGFEAAIRMVRADYCGTGHSFTKPGMPVAIPEDRWSINQSQSGVELEAIWGEKGAHCVYTPRYSSEYPEALTVQKICDELGGHVPQTCKPDDTISVYDGLFNTMNP